MKEPRFNAPTPVRVSAITARARRDKATDREALREILETLLRDGSNQTKVAAVERIVREQLNRSA